ncbi:F-box protein [Artemisia annua]|uniref:F-box protein n=1 Tax=Artemisia annua TaxID=35608 RepID=A0A2U1L6P0_ARTAN|nr:F-box protein [Artemisia annua]
MAFVNFCQGNAEKVLDLFLKTASRGSTPTIMDAVFVYWEIGMMEEGMKIPKRAAKQGDPPGLFCISAYPFKNLTAHFH